MRGLVVFRWLTPTALAALLCIPIQITIGHPMGGGPSMGGMGGIRAGGHPAIASRSFSRNGASRFAQHRDPSSWNHDRFADRRDQFRDSRGLPDRFADRRDRFADRGGRFRREGREGEEREEREFFFHHNFFVAFDFAAFGFWPGWWGPGWWGWDGWSPDDGYYPYNDDQPSSGSQYGAGYWNNLAVSVQTKLAGQGYYHGQVDGVIGSGSIEAIRRYQADHGLPATGKIDPKLLKTLGINYKARA
jgi:hypothetical protein